MTDNEHMSTEHSTEGNERAPVAAASMPVNPPPIVLTGNTSEILPLAFDGERLIPGASGPEVELEHVHRYLFAAQLVAGLDVLDIASGDGYGSDMLAQRAGTVTGVDIDQTAVTVASQRYPRDNLKFTVGRCERIPLSARSVDAVVSFETIEHMEDHDAFMKEIRRVLKPMGTLIISTPDKTVYNAELAEPNHFHVHELEREEFETLLRSHFKNVRLVGQRVAFGSFLAGEEMARFLITSHDPNTFQVQDRSLDRASVYWVAVASDAPLPELPTGLYQGDARPNPISSIMGGVRERDEEIIRLRHLTRDLDETKQAHADAMRALEEAVARREEAQQSLADLQVHQDALREAKRLSRARELEMAARLEDVRDELRIAEVAAARRDGAQRLLLRQIGELQAEVETHANANRAQLARAESLAKSLGDTQVALENAQSARQLAIQQAELLNDQLAAAIQNAGHLAEEAARTADALQLVERLKSKLEIAEVDTQELDWGLRRRSPLFGDVVAFARLVKRFGPFRAAKIIAEARIIRESGLFKQAYYLRRYPDVENARMDPVIHYLAYGVAELRDPAPNFSTRTYIQRYPEIAGARVNPFFHFVRHGHREGRNGATTIGAPLVTSPAPATTMVAPHGAPRAGETTVALATMEPPKDPPAGDLYAVRPDQSVAHEAWRGHVFLETHRLLASAPDFAGAVRALTSKANAQGQAADPQIQPDVSIIIPVYGQLPYTLNCLDALLSHASRFSREILVVDDASPDETSRWLAELAGVRYHRQPENGGFIAACNTGAAMAHGRYLVLLNNDTRVVEGWLDELIGSFETLPDAGLVGSKLFYPDSSLQEAGGIIWSDASAWNFGRNDDPNRPEYCYARQVDYVSGAAIAVPKDLWDQLGGFDTRYAPAYCEDSDLALRIRHEAGRSVWMQPLSRVIHYEGKTSGTDISKGVKAYQVRNSETLRQRWSSGLSAHRANADAPFLEKDRGVTLRALVLDATTPEPDRDAGSLTCFKLIQALQSAGYKVTFAAESNLLYLPGPSAALQRLGVEVLYAPFCASIDDLLRDRGGEFDFVLMFRKEVALRRLKAIRRHCPRARIGFHCSDLHFLREQRFAEIQNDPQALRAAEATRREELKIINDVDVSIVHSTHEYELLGELAPGAPVFVFPWILDPERHVPTVEGRRDIVFLGGYRHPPNVDAVRYFVSEIWPLVRERDRTMRFVIAGADVPPELEALHGQDNVSVAGFIPDLKPFFATMRLSVAPIRYGAGIKGKVAMSLAHGLPVVATSCAAEGMSLEEGDCIVVRDEPEAFAQSIVDLYHDKARWNAMSEHARRFVQENYGSGLARRRIVDILTLAGAPIATK